VCGGAANMMFRGARPVLRPRRCCALPPASIARGAGDLAGPAGGEELAATRPRGEAVPGEHDAAQDVAGGEQLFNVSADETRERIHEIADRTIAGAHAAPRRRRAVASLDGGSSATGGGSAPAAATVAPRAAARGDRGERSRGACRGRRRGRSIRDMSLRVASCVGMISGAPILKAALPNLGRASGFT